MNNKPQKQWRQLLPMLLFLYISLPSVTQAQIRFATFNVSLNRTGEGELVDELVAGNHEQISSIAAIIRRVQPDVILLNEFDFAGERAIAAVEHFQMNYLSKPVDGLKPIEYG